MMGKRLKEIFGLILINITLVSGSLNAETVYADTQAKIEIEKTEILRLDPFLKMGKPQKIASYFGGKDGYLKAVKELEQAKAEKRSNLLYSVIGVLFLVAVVACLIWKSNIISRSATAVTIDGEKYTAAEVSFYYKNVYRSFLQNNSYFISLSLIHI